jgi:hypothetical protein
MDIQKSHLYVNFTNCLRFFEEYIIIRQLTLKEISDIHLKEQEINKPKLIKEMIK